MHFNSGLPKLTFRLIELEHCPKDCQLHNCHGNDRRHIYSVREAKVPSTLLQLINLIIISACSLSTQTIFWQQMIIDLDATYTQLNNAMSVNFVGLSTGCIMFIPLAKKYGRRPVYIASTMLMLVASFWTARLHSLAELYICNLLQGFAGATNEAIVEITVREPPRIHDWTPNDRWTDCGSFLCAPPRPNEWPVYDYGDGWRTFHHHRA